MAIMGLLEGRGPFYQRRQAVFVGSIHRTVNVDDHRDHKSDTLYESGLLLKGVAALQR